MSAEAHLFAANEVSPQLQQIVSCLQKCIELLTPSPDPVEPVRARADYAPANPPVSAGPRSAVPGDFFSQLGLSGVPTDGKSSSTAGAGGRMLMQKRRGFSKLSHRYVLRDKSGSAIQGTVFMNGWLLVDAELQGQHPHINRGYPIESRLSGEDVPFQQLRGLCRACESTIVQAAAIIQDLASAALPTGTSGDLRFFRRVQRGVHTVLLSIQTARDSVYAKPGALSPSVDGRSFLSMYPALPDSLRLYMSVLSDGLVLLTLCSLSLMGTALAAASAGAPLLMTATAAASATSSSGTSAGSMSLSTTATAVAPAPAVQSPKSASQSLFWWGKKTPKQSHPHPQQQTQPQTENAAPATVVSKPLPLPVPSTMARGAVSFHPTGRLLELDGRLYMSDFEVSVLADVDHVRDAMQSLERAFALSMQTKHSLNILEDLVAMERACRSQAAPLLTRAA